MIQFNLLPDVKLEYMKTRRTKRVTIIIAGLVTALALAVFVGLFLIVNVFQRQHLANLNKDIKQDTAQLQAVPDLTKVLTIQNQLGKLTELHEQKPAAARVFDFLGQLTPSKATISSVSVDFSAGTMSINGNADSLSTVNQYVDTLKFTNFVTNNDGNQQKAFSEVVLSSFGKDEKTTSYSITFKFNPEIFNNTKQVTLEVPKITSTRSSTEKPSDLFQQIKPQGQ